MAITEICEKNGKEVCVYEISNQSGMRMKATDYGASIMALEVPDAYGALTDVVLGLDSPREYFGAQPFLGATIGRCANRIAGGRFALHGEKFYIPCNENGTNLLHGGENGFHRAVWEGEELEAGGIRFAYHSPDGEGGFPGAVDVSVEMTLTRENALRLEYEAHTDADTILNLTNHSYFNLRGSGSIESHRLLIEADYYTPVDERLIPTGEIEEVRDTPLDFTRPRAIGRDIGCGAEQMRLCNGYDHNYVLRGEGFRRAARAESHENGLAMEVFTDMPGMQFYTANALDDLAGKGGNRYGPRSAYCFETQLFPDGVNHANFPCCILRKGERYHSVTEYRFSVISGASKRRIPA